MWVRASRWMVKWELLIFIVAAVVSFRIPTLFEPYWYGDEGVYLTIGQALNRGTVLYSGIHDNKPPLLYWLAALANGQVFWFKLILLIWMAVTVVAFFFLARRLVGKWATLCTFVFAFLTTTPVWEGNIANAELFFLLPIIVGFGLVLTDELKLIFAGGLFYGLAVLFKVPAIFSAGVWPIVWVWQRHPSWIKKCVLWGVGISIPILISFGIAWYQGALREYTTAAWLQNIPYLSSWKAAGIETGYTLKVRAIVAAIALALLLGFSSRLGKMATLIGIWGVLDLFAALLSGRPYPHYLIQLIPSLAIGITLGIRDVRSRWIAGGLLVLLGMSAFVFRFYSYSGIKYYKNYLSWGLGRKTTQEYRGWFDGRVNNNYEIAATVRMLSREDEAIFVWGDQPMIYALSRRRPCGVYTVRYHILDFSSQDTAEKAVLECNPKIIVDFGGWEKVGDDYRPVNRVGEAVVYARR